MGHYLSPCGVVRIQRQSHSSGHFLAMGPVSDLLHLPRAGGTGPRSQGCLEELDQPTPHRDRLIAKLVPEILWFIDPD